MDLPRQFSLFRFRRYDLDSLSKCLAELGWDAIAQYPIAYPNGGGHATMIFRKRAMP